MDYLGNKARFADDIARLMTVGMPPGQPVADLFAGTGSVSAALAHAGHAVAANDWLPLSATWTRARLLGAGTTFRALEGELGPLGHDPLATVVTALSRLAGVEGWITRNYSPVSRHHADVERRYLTEANARHVDAIRLQLRAWKPLLTEPEHAVLMASLLDAVNDVSNVAGTYGCYLKEWKRSATRPMTLQPYRDAVPSGQHSVSCRDAETVAAETEAAALYADPPYTKRQYPAYYHLLNSIATDGEPTLSGSTGLPDWRPLASEWCYKQRAPRALERLVTKSSAPVVALSYSSDGHIPHDVFCDILGAHGTVAVHEFTRRRYRSSSLPHKGADVVERLYVMQR